MIRPPAAAPGATFQMVVHNTGTRVDCPSELTLLEAAVAAGLDFPYACASGNCGVCVCRLNEGTVSMLPRSDASLSSEQASSGHTLACRARPLSDVAITWLGRGRR